MAYPTDLDTFTTHNTGDVIEASYDNAQQVAISALEAKVGVDSSAVTTSHDYKLSGVTGSDKAVSKTGTETLTNKTLTSPTITSPTLNLGSDAEGDTYYRNSSGALARLARGTDNYIYKMNGNVPNWEAETTLQYDEESIAVGAGNKIVTQTGLQNSVEKYAADSGSSTAYVITLSPAPTAYVAGQTFTFKAGNTNTSTTPTLNVNSLGAKTIVSIGGSTIMIGAILTGGTYQVTYDGTNFQLLNPTRYQEFIFNSGTSTWTCPRGVSTVLVDIVAGGGGGGHNANNDNKSYGGGGGGAGATNVSSSVTALTAYSVVVGAGGAGATTAGNTGTTGGTSSFNGISKTGGAGGTGSATGTSAGGAAGDSSAGAGGNGSQSSSTAGQNGQTGTGGGTGGTGGAVSGSMSGGGGGGASGIGGPAGGAGGSGIGGSGQAGVGYGTGGGGGANQGQGGNGAGGLVIIKVPMNQYI